ncbi:MAG: hypothetical protein ACTSV2_00330 [Candidatus Thorarchaeota archaeon]
MDNKMATMLCFLGGILLIIVSATGSIGFFQYLALLAGVAEIAEYYWIIELLLNILLYIAALGGIAVVIGALLIMKSREGTGKFVIGIAVGMSLIGLIIQLITMVYFSGVAAALNFFILASQSLGWIGIFLTIFGRKAIKSD